MFRFGLSDTRVLRLLEETDADELYAVAQANREYLAHWVPWAERQTLENTRSQAVTALVDWAFGAWKLNRVEIQAAVENHRSRAIPARLGFREEGTLRQAERVGSRHLDHVVYSMLAEDWAARSVRSSGHDDRGPLEATGS